MQLTGNATFPCGLLNPQRANLVNEVSVCTVPYINFLFFSYLLLLGYILPHPSFLFLFVFFFIQCKYFKIQSVYYLLLLLGIHNNERLIVESFSGLLLLFLFNFVKNIVADLGVVCLLS